MSGLRLLAAWDLGLFPVEACPTESIFMVYKLFLHLEELDQSTKPSILASRGKHPPCLATEEGLTISQKTPPCSLENIPDSISEDTLNMDLNIGLKVTFLVRGKT